MKKRLAVIVTFLLLLSLAGCNSVSGSGKTVIEVNGKKITQKQYDERYSILKANYELQSGSKLDESKDKETIKSLKETAYNNLVLQELIVEDAKKQGVDASTKEIDTRLASFKENQNKYSVDGYKLFLEKLNLTEAKLRDELKIQILSEKMQAKVAGNTTVSDAEVKKYYDDNQSEFKQAGGIQIYHILVSDEKLAKDIITKIKAGQDFAALAKQYSTDPGSKDKGGDVGVVNQDTNFVPEFKKAALALKTGEVTPQPVKSEFGYHIIKAGEKKEASVIPFDEAKAQIKSELEKNKSDQTFNTYLENLKKKATIKDLRSK